MGFSQQDGAESFGAVSMSSLQKASIGIQFIQNAATTRHVRNLLMPLLQPEAH